MANAPELMVSTSPDRKVAIQISDAGKILVAVSFEPDAAKGIADQIMVCADMALAGAPPKRMDS